VIDRNFQSEKLSQDDIGCGHGKVFSMSKLPRI